MMRNRQQRPAQVRILAPKPVRPGHQPQVQFVVHYLAGPQLRLKVIRILHQVARMYLEELCEQQPGRIRQVRPCTRLDLRKVRTARSFYPWSPQQSHALPSCCVIARSKPRSEPSTSRRYRIFSESFTPQPPITICNNSITNRDICQRSRGRAPRFRSTARPASGSICFCSCCTLNQNAHPPSAHLPHAHAPRPIRPVSREGSLHCAASRRHPHASGHLPPTCGGLYRPH